MPRRQCLLLSGLMVSALSAVARADVPPPPDCRDIAVYVMPAPIDAHGVAIRWVPASSNYVLVGARLVAEDGTAIALDIITDAKFALLLKPRTAAIAPGAYRLEYSDTCSDAAASRDVVFSSAPPIKETPALMEVSNEPSNCTLPPRPSEGGPVIQTATVPLDDTLSPYRPFLRVTLRTQTGSGGGISLGEVIAPTGGAVTFKFLHQCWVGPQIAVLPVVPRGQNDLTTTGILADGVVAFVKKATVDFNCNHCDAGTSSADADVVLDGGAADVSDNGTTSVSTPGGSGESCNCSTSRGPTTSLMPWITALTAITFARRRRR